MYQRTDEPCPRCGRPIRRIVVGGARDALLLVVPAAAGRQTVPGRGRSCGRSSPRRRGGRWTELPAGEGSVGLTPAERGARTERTAPRGGALGVPLHGPRSGADRVDPAPDRRPSRGRDVRDPRLDHRSDRARRPDRAGRSERRRQDDAAPDRRRRRRAGRRRGRPEARPQPRPAGPGVPLRRRVHGRAGPPDRPCAHGAAHLDAIAARARRATSASTGSRSRPTPTSSTSSTSSAATPLDQRVDEALSGLGLRAVRLEPAADGAVGRRADAGARWPAS